MAGLGHRDKGAQLIKLKRLVQGCPQRNARLIRPARSIGAGTSASLWTSRKLIPAIFICDFIFIVVSRTMASSDELDAERVAAQ
jgi:hypothetical protein